MLLRRLLPWLCALILLLGQAVAYAHTLSHLSDHESNSPAHPCELCVAQASLGGAAPSSAFALPLPIATFDWHIATTCPTPAPRLSAPRARAPPASI